jgi:hypothetical protein
MLYQGLDSVRHKLKVLREPCHAEERDYDSLDRSILDTAQLAPGQQDGAALVDHCRALAAVGVTHAIFNMPNVHNIASLETFGQETIPALREL